MKKFNLTLPASQNEFLLAAIDMAQNVGRMKDLLTCGFCGATSLFPGQIVSPRKEIKNGSS